MDAFDKYDELKKSGNLPLFCKIYENLQFPENERLLGDISSDPVYSFLTEVEKNVETIAMEQYERSPEYKEADTGDQDADVYLNSKESFLRSMISSIEYRSGLDKITCDWSSSAKINSPERYNYLAGLAKLVGEERSEAIKEFVREFPSYPWEVFSWPKEK
jgi:hypothetical protein